jgi:hypothetical protein
MLCTLVKITLQSDMDKNEFRSSEKRLLQIGKRGDMNKIKEATEMTTFRSAVGYIKEPG